MSVRAAVAGDLPAIMTLERACFPTDAWSEAMMAAELASPHGRYVVDDEGGRIVGYGGVRAVERAADADIQTIAISPLVRGRGRGRVLLDALLEIARERGARDVFLEVRADNPVATALYVSEGFAEIGRRARYYQPDDVDAVVMKLELVGWTARAGTRIADAGGSGLVASVRITQAESAPAAPGGAGAGVLPELRTAETGAEGGAGLSASVRITQAESAPAAPGGAGASVLPELRTAGADNAEGEGPS